MTLKHKLSLYSASVSVLALLATPILAQTSSDTNAQNKGRLDEIIVTARKRAESLQDVPISVQAIKGEQIQAQGLFDLAALAPYTPNFSMMQAPGAADLIFMRGVGTFGSGIHFEPSVGQVFNGFFSTRSRLSRTALIDVAQVEVLKGPQGAIIGKNTSLGALNITSNRPTDEFEGSLSTAYNFEASEGFEVQGILSGPLSENVRARVVVDYQDVDGWVNNRTTGRKTQEKKDLTIRGMLDWDVTNTFTASLLYQYNDLNRNGKPREVVDCFDPGVIPRTGVRPEVQGFICGLDGTNQQGNFQRTSPGGALFNPGEPFTTEAHIAGLTLNWELDGFEITSLSNYTTYDITDNFSGDLLPTERVNIQNVEEYNQFYQEVRAASTGDGAFDWIIGATYFEGDLEFAQFFHHIAANMGMPVRRNEFARSDTKSLAAFGQVEFDLSERFTATLGGRFTNEDRNGARAQGPSAIYTPIPNLIDNPLPVTPGIACGPGFVACTNGDGTPNRGTIDDSAFSYNGSLQYRPNGDNMFYASIGTGFKSGGFDLRGGGNIAKFIFPEEKSTNYEIGGKHTLADGNVRFNWTLFQLEVEDLQVSANDPVLIQQIVSKAQVTSKGLEVDGAWAATDALTFTFAGAYLDATFDQFISSCFTGQTAAQGCNGGLFTQDGLSLPQAPELQFVLGTNYTMDVGSDMQLTFGGTWSLLSDYHVALERDPGSFQDSVSRFDASVTLRGQTPNDNDWSLALIGRNLSNELVRGFCNASGLSGAGVLSCAVEETRFISVRGSLDF